jgi:thymidylate kinase
VGRSTAAAGPLVGRISNLIQEETAYLTSRADLFLRVARDYQRAYQAALEPNGVVVLDRFVLSTLALAHLRGQEIPPMVGILRDVARRAHLYATVFVQCPFEVARPRVRRREPRLGVPEGHPAELTLRRLPEIMERDFRDGLLTGKQWVVDNSGALEDAERQLADYLLPFLRQPLPEAERPTVLDASGDTATTGGCLVTPT